MSDDVKRWQDGTDMAGHAIYVVPAADFDRVVAERDAVRDALAGVMPFVEYPAECICDKTPTSECNCNLEWAQANYQRNLNAANAALAAVRREAAR